MTKQPVPLARKREEQDRLCRRSGSDHPLRGYSVGGRVRRHRHDESRELPHRPDHKHGGAPAEDRNTASIPPDVTKTEPGPAVTEDEINKLSDEFVKKEKIL